jgi:hypothetical protein
MAANSHLTKRTVTPYFNAPTPSHKRADAGQSRAVAHAPSVCIRQLSGGGAGATTGGGKGCLSACHLSCTLHGAQLPFASAAIVP